MSPETFKAIVDGLVCPIVFCDTEHIIRYMNDMAKEQYAKWGGREKLIGRSILDCHNENSCRIMLETFELFKQGEGARYIYFNTKRDKKAFMHPVRDESGNLLGYYERFE